VIASLKTAVALTAIEALAAEVVSESPDVRAAVSVIFSAFVYCTELRVTELFPAVIVAVLPNRVPTRPGPEWVLMARKMSVLAKTLAGFP